MISSPPLNIPSRPIPRSPYVSLSRTPNSPLNDVLSLRDSVGHGLLLQGLPIRRVSPKHSPPQSFEVVRKLGSGSYAVVYLAREILNPQSLPFHDDLPDLDLHLQPPILYGKEFAIKCLSKANLNREALDAQLFEATVHQSLPVHPNIVTLHCTLETDAHLLLVLECVPGDDLFYFLEQSRDDHHPPQLPSTTPPTPSLLSSLHPAQLLSPTRLRLIASMFAQMCHAVATCHSVGVFHRDIKPENFIVTDGWAEGERKVLVKLTDFGLATKDSESPDMDCGSAPYMSYECRNNCAPTYATAPADVWSLGIVLINMLYHHNPWSDTTDGVCPSFEAFRAQPIPFFIQRFPGMTRPVAEFLATRVFCILDSQSRRVSAAEFGRWVRALPTLLAHHSPIDPPALLTPVTPSPRSRRPSSRSRPPSRGPSDSRPSSPRPFELAEPDLQEADEHDHDHDNLDDVEACSRSTSTARRRKRGVRKGRGLVRTRDPSEDLAENLAAASQVLVREISKTSRTSSSKPTSPARSATVRASTPPPPVPSPVKKQSKWKVFRMSSPDTAVDGTSSPPVPPPHHAEVEPLPTEPSATATNVSTVLMGLYPVPRDSAKEYRGRPRRQQQRPPSPPRVGVNSSNWRTASSSASSISGASSSFTRFSNGSVRSVSTVATSVSGIGSSVESWRHPQTDKDRSSPPQSPAPGKKSRPSPFAAASSPKQKPPLPPPPPNLKIVSGVPWELVGPLLPPMSNLTEQDERELPRGSSVRPQEHAFAPPPWRYTMKAQAKARALDPINERAPVEREKERERERERGSGSSGEEDEYSPRKVQKGQINALAKMLSHLKASRGAH